MKVSGHLAALHIASLWCIAVAQPLFDVLQGSPEFFVAHDAGPADLVGLVLLFCLAGPALVHNPSAATRQLSALWPR